MVDIIQQHVKTDVVEVLTQNIINIIDKTTTKLKQSVGLNVVGYELMNYAVNQRNTGIKLKKFIENQTSVFVVNKNQVSLVSKETITEVKVKKFTENQTGIFVVNKNQVTLEINEPIRKNVNSSVCTSFTSNCNIPLYMNKLEILKEMTFSRNTDSIYVLDSYINAIYSKSVRDNLILSNEGVYVCFNTGLLSCSFKNIYALLKKPEDIGLKYDFVSFCVPGIGQEGKLLVRKFPKLPKQPKFFQSTSELIFEAKGKFHTDYPHIIIDNADRLPKELVNSVSGFESVDVEKLQKKDYDMYLEGLRETLSYDNISFQKLVSKFNAAIDIAQTLLSVNYKVAVPFYSFSKKKILFLLPLYLTSLQKADMALVVEKCNTSDNILAHSAIPLLWAYKMARLISIVESDWLRI